MGRLQCVVCALLAACFSLTLFGVTPEPDCGFGLMANGKKPRSMAQKLAVRADLEAKLEAAQADLERLDTEQNDLRVKKLVERDRSRLSDLNDRYMAAVAKLGPARAKVQAIKVAMAGLPKPEVAAPQSLAEWKRIPAAKRTELLSELLEELSEAPDGRSEHKGFKFTTVPLESWDNAVYDPFGKKILATFKRDMGELPDTQEDQIRVGEPGGSVHVVRLPDGTPIGGVVKMVQSGATRKVRSDQYYEDLPTWEAAKRAGFEDNDVSWSVTLQFNEKGELLPSQDTYWDWSGH